MLWAIHGIQPAAPVGIEVPIQAPGKQPVAFRRCSIQEAAMPREPRGRSHETAQSQTKITWRDESLPRSPETRIPQGSPPVVPRFSIGQYSRLNSMRAASWPDPLISGNTPFPQASCLRIHQRPGVFPDPLDGLHVAL